MKTKLLKNYVEDFLIIYVLQFQQEEFIAVIKNINIVEI